MGSREAVRDFRYLAPRLAEARRVVRLDMPGFGETPIGDRGRSPRAGGLFIIRAMEALGIKRATLVSHSAGSVYLAAAAAQAPDMVERVALLAPHGLRPHRALTRGALQPMARLLSLPLVPRLLAARLRRDMERMGFHGHSDTALARTLVLAAHNAKSAEHPRNLRAIAAPCLLSWARDDKMIETTIFEELAEAMPKGPRLAFDSGGHAIQKTQAAAIAEAIIAWQS